MKNFLLTLIALFSCNIMFAQILSEDNFDSYTVGDKMAVVSATDWQTWSDKPGGNEDPTISDQFASSPANALHVVDNNDIVYLLGDKASGRYAIKFNILIESGHIGYFNALQKFSANSEWGLQVYFNPNGKGTMDAGKSNVVDFLYNYDEWIPVIVFIDIDSDYASLSINGIDNVAWQWSKGSFGSGTLNQLAGVNFYGTTTGGSSSMFIDDLAFLEQEAPAAPTNLSATLVDGKDVQLKWDASDISGVTYVISNGTSIIKATTDIEYTDENIYPGEVNYTVRISSQTQGHSAASNEVTILRPGGGDRNLVLFEVGTGTGCPNCPSAARGVDDMVEKNENVAILEYHNYNTDDPFNCTDAADRTSYYGISGYPTQFHDGTVGIKGGGFNGTLYNSYHDFYTERYDVAALYGITVDIDATNSTEYTASITIDENSDYYIDKIKKLRVAVTETHIPYNWQGLSKIDFAVRQMFPNAEGTIIDFASGTKQSVDIPFNLDPSWVKENCELIVFLQTDDNKEVLQTIKLDMADIVTSVEDINSIHVDLYPNPATDVLFTNINSRFNYTIYSITGQRLDSGSTYNSIDISSINSGIYFIDITTIEGNTKMKFIKE